MHLDAGAPELRTETKYSQFGISFLLQVSELSSFDYKFSTHTQIYLRFFKTRIRYAILTIVTCPSFISIVCV